MSDFLQDRDRVVRASDDSGARKPSSFKPLIAGRVNHTKAELKEDEELTEVEVSQENSEQSSPKVQLLTEAGQVKRIIVTCGCGQYIELECNY